MFNLLLNPWFAGLAGPLIAAGLTIYLKYTSKNDRYARFSKEDCAVGLELGVAAVFGLVASIPLVASSANVAEAIAIAKGDGSVPSPEEAVASTLILAGIWGFGLVGVSTIVRKTGWRDATTLSTVSGFLIPTVYGVAALCFASYWIVKGT